MRLPNGFIVRECIRIRIEVFFTESRVILLLNYYYYFIIKCCVLFNKYYSSINRNLSATENASNDLQKIHRIIVTPFLHTLRQFNL